MQEIGFTLYHVYNLWWIMIELIVIFLIGFIIYKYRNADSVEIDGHTYHIDGRGNGRP